MQLQQFNFEGNDIRAIDRNGNPWFVAKDVCDYLGYSNVSKSISDHIDDEDRYNYSLERGGFIIIVNESGLYSLILRSNKPEAKIFKRWLTSEVIPSIKKTGQYSKPLSTFEMIAQMAQASAEMEKKIQIQERRIEQIENKVEKKFTNEFEMQLVTPTQIGAMFEPTISGKKVNQLLREKGFQHQAQGQWIPTVPGREYSSTDYIQLSNGKMTPQLLWQRRIKEVIA